MSLMVHVRLRLNQSSSLAVAGTHLIDDPLLNHKYLSKNSSDLGHYVFTSRREQKNIFAKGVKVVVFYPYLRGRARVPVMTWERWVVGEHCGAPQAANGKESFVQEASGEGALQIMRAPRASLINPDPFIARSCCE